MSIENHSGDNISEVVGLWLIPSHDVESLPQPDSDFEVDFGDFSLKSGKNFEKIYFSANSCAFTEDDKVSENGPYMDKKIVARIPKNRAEVMAWLNEHRHYYHYAVVRDANGTFYLIGDKMQMQFNRSSPKQSTEFGGYEITLACDSIMGSPHINNCTLT
jgi:hypothetical protein